MSVFRVNPPIFAFDFSLNKPALSAYVESELSFHVFPMNMDSKSEEMLCDAGCEVINRGWGKIHDEAPNSHELIVKHVERAYSLATIIIEKMVEILHRHYSVDEIRNVVPESYVINEGLAFAANGDAALDLSGYKYIFMMKMMEYGFKNFYTYQPTSIKSVAGCAKRGEGKTKDRMIEAFRQDNLIMNKFKEVILNSPDDLKKKTAYVECVDDIADSYWNLITFMKRDGKSILSSCISSSTNSDLEK